MTTTPVDPRTDKRVKVPLSDAQLRDLADLRDPDTALGQQTRQLAGANPRSESAAAALLLDLGLRLVRDLAEEAGYAALAAERATEAGRAERDTLRQRRQRTAERWAAE